MDCVQSRTPPSLQPIEVVMNNKKLAHVLVVVMLAALAACSGNPNVPTPPPTARDGQVTITYQQPSACLSAGTQFAGFCDRAKFPVTVGGISWPQGYSLSTEMIPRGDGTFTVTVTVPSSTWAGRLRIAISDPWLCSAQPICDVQAFTGNGITANGTILSGGQGETSFLFTPPSTVSR